MGEHAGLDGVDEVEANGALLEPAQQRLEALDVHRLGEAVVQRLAHERVIGDLDGTRRGVVLAGGEGREDGGHEVVRLHALDVERVEPAALAAQHGERPVEVPAPAGGEHRAAEHGLGHGGLHARRAKERGHVLQRERVLGAERQQHGVVAGSCLQLEVERQAELLAQPEAERPVDSGAERGVDDQLHAARPRRRTARRRCRRGWGARRPARPGPRPGSRRRGRRQRRRRRTSHAPARWPPPVRRRRAAPIPRPAAARPPRTARPCGSGASPSQNGTVGCLPAASRTRMTPPDHLHDLPWVGTQQEHVALLGLDGEVLVHGAHEHVAGLHQHPVVAGLGDRSAGGERGQPGAAAAAEAPADAVAVQVGHAPAAPGLDAGRDQLDDLLELLPGQAPVRPRAGDQVEQLVLGHAVVAAGGGLGHDLLGEDVERLLGRMERVEAAAPDRGQQRHALDQLVPRGRVHDPAGDTRALVVGPARPAAGRWRCCAESRSGTPARPARRRCRAPARPWPRARAGRPPVAAAPRAGGARVTATRDGRPPGPVPTARRARCATRSDSFLVLTNTSVVRCFVT